MNITLTKEEINTTIQLIDLAVKAGGLNVANAALSIVKKLQDAAPVETANAE